MEAPAHILEALRNIRSGFYFKWNPKAVLVKAGGYDAWGKLKNPEYEGRFELWDVDPDGRDYMVMSIQTATGGFAVPNERTVEHVRKFDPSRYGGSIEKMLAAVEADADRMKEIEDKDFDNLAQAAAQWMYWLHTPKSGGGLSFRGQRKLAPGM